MTEPSATQPRRGLVASWKASFQSQKSLTIVCAMLILYLVLFRIIPSIQHIFEAGKHAAGGQ